MAMTARFSMPTVVVDRHRAQRNISRMQATAQAAGVTLRPHFKTHQSVAIGAWFGPPAETPIAVSSVAMAELFAAHGWRDILLAIPLNPAALERYQALAQQVRLSLTVEHHDALATLAAINHPIDVSIELDAGYARSGIPVRDIARISELLLAVQQLPQVQQLSLLLHAGNSYQCRGDAEIAALQQQTLSAVAQLRPQLPQLGKPLLFSYGDTPSCSRLKAFPGVDEIRPGNYVFYDLMQQQIGACAWDDIALAVACPVIGRYPERNEVIVHGGAVHFSKDYVLIEGQQVFGQVMQPSAVGWGAPMPAAQLIGVSQEHGKVRMPAAQIAELALGDTLWIVPAHSCLVMDASKGDCQII